MRTIHEIASEYCAWIERTYTPPDLETWLPGILAELIHVTFLLPDDGEADAGVDGHQPRDYQQIKASLPELPFDFYSEIFDAMEMKAEPVIGSLRDDLADIYREMAEGLYHHEYASPAEAELFWRQSFRYHWGEHATGALRALYCAHRHKDFEA
jgi:hypothetical protein